MAQPVLYSTDEKVAITKESLSERYTLVETAKKYGISLWTLKEWRHHYETEGYEWFVRKHKQKEYSQELKQQAVQDYLSGEHTQHEIMNKYKIVNRASLKQWITMYNGHNTLKSSNNGGYLL